MTSRWVDQLTFAAKDPGVALLLRQARREIPQPLAVTGVGPVEPAGPDLRAGWPEQDLRAGGCGLVVEVPQHDHSPLLPLSVQKLGGSFPDGG